MWWSCAQSSTGRSPQAASSASRCGAGSPAGQRAARQPAPISQPSAPAGGAGRGRQHLGVRARPGEIEPPERERPLQEVHVRVGEARHDAAPVEVDALVGDERAIALAHVDAAADAVARDGERARQGERRVAGAHAAVVQDHAAEGSPSLSSASVLPPPPPADELARRIAAFQAGLQRDGLDAALIVQSADLVYLSGTAQNAHLVVPADGRAAAARAPRPRAGAGRERADPRRAVHLAARAAGRARVARPDGHDPARASSSTCSRPRPTSATASSCRPPMPADCMPALWSARSRKSEWELDAHPRSPASRRRLAMEYAPQLLVPGRLECDVLSELGHHMRLHGHEGTIRFRGINSEFLYGQVLAGASGAVPGPTETPLHGPGLSTAQGRGPSRRPLRDGDAVVIDVSGLAEGYVSDQTRTFFVGHADPGAARGVRDLPPHPRRVRRAARAGHAWERALRARARGRHRGRVRRAASWARETGACASSATASASS